MAKGESFSQVLQRTRERLSRVLQGVLGRSSSVAEVLEDIEEGLLQADVGVEVTEIVLQRLRHALRRGEVHQGAEVLALLREVLLSLLPVPPPESFPGDPTVVMLVGVNGFGKTTTAAKLAYRWQQQGKRPLLAAADTFRAAAIEQLQRWAQTLGIPCIRHHYGSDPAAVAYDAVHAARARGLDVVLVDTAGRLHTKTALMAELEKLVRVLRRLDPVAPHETFLVLDASIGHNALAQAREFVHHLPLSGVVLTKLDGSARGGMALAIAHTYGLPIRYVGTGEGLGDLLPFEPAAFVEGLLSAVPTAAH